MSLSRQMFLQVGTLTQQPSHSLLTHTTQGAPRPSLHTNQFENEEFSKRERAQGVKVPVPFTLPLLAIVITCQTLCHKDEHN